MRTDQFTVEYPGRANELITDVWVCRAFRPDLSKLEERPSMCRFKALWDTGATHSAISQRVVDQCGLAPIGMTTAHTAGGSVDTEVYLVNLGLPNRVGVAGVRVSRATIHGLPDVLIGMDVILLGDFAITNTAKKTVFSFRYPSIERIDFTDKNRPPQLPIYPKVPRNDDCPCGSGKKYKKCHGA
jgi:hypothetical protein